MLKVLSNILCDLDPKVKVIGQKAGICDGLPSTSALVIIIIIPKVPKSFLWSHYIKLRLSEYDFKFSKKNCQISCTVVKNFTAKSYSDK